ncbi:MAG TPA: sulfurtransferase [Myxococcales bacterium]|nr:sulfurtransferase [Myxococcales bacterium]
MRPIDPLVSAAWLQARRGEPGLRIVDVRWRLGQPGAGRKLYDAGHLPGAVYLDVDGDLAGPPGSGPGRHPLPTPARFAEAMARAGVGDSTRVVAYDDQGGAIAARLWFLLRYFGHETGAVLDGGLAAWPGPLTADVPAFPRAPFTARPHPELVVDRQVVARGGALVLDARAPERYRGDLEPVDPKAGHIPGALSAPFAGNLDGSGRFLPRERLRERFAALGATAGREIIAYCGSGVTACNDLLALELAGVPAKLYEGSWSDWSSDPAAPVAQGD